MAEHYFLYAFGVNGTLNAIPNPTQIAGTVSYQTGFPIGYQLANTAPGYLSIPRDQFNQLMFDTTGAIQQIQQTGFPSWITSAANGGSSFQYALGAEVWYNGIPYRSLAANNTDTPPSSNWAVIGENRSLYFNAATDTGSANHYVIAPNPAIASYADGDVIQLRPGFANTGACDINVNGLGVISIKTLANVDPLSGMINPAGCYQLVYNGNTGCFVLQNPTLGSAAYLNVGTAANNILQLNGSAQIPAVSGALLTGLLSGIAGNPFKIVLQTLGITIQGGKVTATSNTYSGTFATAFSGTPYAMVFNGTVANAHTTSTNDCVTSLTSTGYTVTGDGIVNGQSFYWLAAGPT